MQTSTCPFLANRLKKAALYNMRYRYNSLKVWYPSETSPMSPGSALGSG
nr:MAG TPA: hypothetical protein [Bacteriophage sp.]